MKVGRFFRTPKGLLIIVLALLSAVAALGEGVMLVLPGLFAGVAAAMLVDVSILWMRKGKWIFPDGALLTGLIVAMILSPREPWYVTAITSAIGVVSKYLFRVRTANVFNPAALALVATFYVFDTAQSWWGALSEIPPVASVVLLATGAFIAQRVNKIPVMLAFLGSYYLLFTITALVGDPAKVAELYVAPDVQTALFFAFFMVTDPPTSPPGHRDQVVYGVITGVVSYAAFELIGAAYYLLAGLLVANVWEAWRRHAAAASFRGVLLQNHG
ncbi:MAG: RnfABCDGE type electron transport complex subunit D [Gemmatimonadales bacterium]